MANIVFSWADCNCVIFHRFNWVYPNSFISERVAALLFVSFMAVNRSLKASQQFTELFSCGMKFAYAWEIHERKLSCESISRLVNKSVLMLHLRKSKFHFTFLIDIRTAPITATTIIVSRDTSSIGSNSVGINRVMTTIVILHSTNHGNILSLW